MQKCAGAIITWLIHQQAIQERDRELYTYALYNMVLLIIPLGLTVIFGEIIGNVKQGIVMMLPFITLRKYSGGYHAKTPLRCMIISSLLLFLCIKITSGISCSWRLLLFTVIMGVSLVLLSPVDSDKRKLDKQQKRKYRKVVCVLVLFFLASTVGLKEIHMEKYAVSVAVGICLSAGLQFPCLVKKIKSIKTDRKMSFGL